MIPETRYTTIIDELFIEVLSMTDAEKGKRTGKFILLPTSETKIVEFFSEIGANPYDSTSYMMIDCDGVINMYSIEHMCEDIWQVNELAKLVHENYNEIEALCNWGYFSSIDELRNNLENCIVYDTPDMADVAREILEETGDFYKIPEYLREYIDFEEYGAHLEKEWQFTKTCGNKIVQVI